MDLYMIRRRSGWTSPEELEKAAARSREVADSEFPQDIRWIRSYVVPEEDGSLGTFCVYQASSDEAIRRHAERVGMPADEIEAIADTVVIRPDPEPTAA
jgi:sporulation protein YlmC with PRC-barrel domain